MSAIWESANWTWQFGIRQTGNQQFGISTRLPNPRLPNTILPIPFCRIPYCRLLLKMTKFHHIILYLKKKY